jgi:hypothetical protein
MMVSCCSHRFRKSSKPLIFRAVRWAFAARLCARFRPDLALRLLMSIARAFWNESRAWSSNGFAVECAETSSSSVCCTCSIAYLHKNSAGHAAKPANNELCCFGEVKRLATQQLAYWVRSMSPSLMSRVHSAFSAILRAKLSSKVGSDGEPASGSRRSLLSFGGDVESFVPVTGTRCCCFGCCCCCCCLRCCCCSCF